MLLTQTSLASSVNVNGYSANKIFDTIEVFGVHLDAVNNVVVNGLQYTDYSFDADVKVRTIY